MEFNFYSKDRFNDVSVIKNMLINKDEVHRCLNSSDIDTFFKYEVINNYIELNEIINNIRITDNQYEIMILIMDGFSYSEIGRMTNRPRQAIHQSFERLCINIAEEKGKRARCLEINE